MSLVRVPREPRLLQVDVSGRQLRPYVHNALQRGVLDLPGRPVQFMARRVRVEQVASHRDSYVNAFLIQSRGILTPTPCSSCVSKMRMDRDSYASPFPYCMRLPGHFGGCCGNCKWPDRAAQCSNRDSVAPGGVRNGGSGSQPGSRAQPIALLEDVPGSSASEPIQLDEEGTRDDPVELD